jgi:uncharacterized OsmC-like protein
MAVFQGARLRSTALPAAQPVARARVAAPATVGSSPRVRPMGLLMAGIIAATMLGLVYLTQTLGSNATTTDIRLLGDDRAELTTEIHRHELSVLQRAGEENVIGAAHRQKLKRLDARVVLSAP